MGPVVVHTDFGVNVKYGESTTEDCPGYFALTGRSRRDSWSLHGSVNMQLSWLDGAEHFLPGQGAQTSAAMEEE